nr:MULTISPECIES: helix-turn-helix domain-containing protein [Paenibacillus]
MIVSIYLELPELNKDFSFKSFVNSGAGLCYPHWHKEIEIIYVTKGSLELGINDVPIRMHAGQIQFIVGGDVHYFLAAPEGERIVIQFDLSLFYDSSTDADRKKSISDSFMKMEHSSWKWPEHVMERMRALVEDMHEENVSCREGYMYMVKARLFEMLPMIFRDIPRNEMAEYASNGNIQSRETLEQLERVFSYVEEHYQESVTLKEVAEYMGFDPFYFSRLFKKNTGKNFITFLNEYRLNKAKWLLLTEEGSMADVAEASGFGSVKTFHHLFKEATGLSPLKYRKTLAGKE